MVAGNHHYTQPVNPVAITKWPSKGGRESDADGGADYIRSKPGSAKPKVDPMTPKLFLTMDETAHCLGISSRSLYSLTAQHRFYAPDGHRSTIENPKKRMPLWSDKLVKLIAFARTLTAQGVRQLTDDEGLKIRNGMNDSERARYLAFIEQ